MKPVKLAMALGLATLALAPMPAFAAFCANEGPMAPYTIEEEDGQSKLVTDTVAQEALDKQRLREVGVVASSVERWNGCLRAFVRGSDGRNTMQMYDPATLLPKQ